jgi:hypothetical protein
MALCALSIVVGAGLYGATMGWWRDPKQGLYVAIKLPLILLFTTAGNALLNSMLAPLLGLNISLRQSIAAVLMSFAIAALVLGGFAPVTAYMIWNTPPLTSDVPSARGVHSIILLTHVMVIAFAGIVSNVHLLGVLKTLAGSQAAGLRVLFAWLAGNLFLGSQLSWILRPFIGAPGLPVQFLRPDAFQGNFYETVFRSIARVLNLS